MNFVRTSALLLGAAVASLIVTPAASLARPVAAEDLFKVRLLDGAVLSPDGMRVAVAVETLDGPNDTYDSTIDLVDVATGKTVDATHGMHDRSAAWAPDGRSFYFVRREGKAKAQIFRDVLATGRIVAVTHLPDGASAPIPSHDGTRLLFTVVQKDAPHAAYVDFAKAGFTPKKSQRTTDIRTIRAMHFASNGEGYTYDAHAHLWVANVDGSHARALTTGRYAEGDASWSPDDRTIVFTSLRYESPSLGPNDIYAIPANGGVMRKLASGEASNTSPRFGRGASDRVWFLSGGVTDPAAYPALVSARLDGGDRREVVAKNTVSWGDALLADMKEGGGACSSVAPGDRTMILNTDGPGYANLKQLDLASGTLRDLTPPRGEAWSCSLSRDGATVAYLYSDFTHPADVYVVNTHGGAPRRVTHVNDAYLAAVTLSRPQPFTVTDSAGLRVQAWFMPALGATLGSTRKFPTILNIHGGPETQFGDTFFHEFQVWASRGYNVVFADPRGSVGFGYDFEEALAKDWGNAMFDDEQAVMDAAVKRPEVDASRVAVLGGSYGGYATLWMISHTDRFKTAVAERVVSDLQSESLAADLASDNALGAFYTWGKPWAQGSLYPQLSPINYVENVHTPLMILHSSEDTRTPIDQTLQEFNALRILGKPVTYVDVPRENHDLSRTGEPIHRVERLNLIAEWLRTHL